MELHDHFQRVDTYISRDFGQSVCDAYKKLVADEEYDMECIVEAFEEDDEDENELIEEVGDICGLSDARKHALWKQMRRIVLNQNLTKEIDDDQTHDRQCSTELSAINWNIDHQREIPSAKRFLSAITGLPSIRISNNDMLHLFAVGRKNNIALLTELNDIYVHCRLESKQWTLSAFCRCLLALAPSFKKTAADAARGLNFFAALFHQQRVPIPRDRKINDDCNAYIAYTLIVARVLQKGIDAMFCSVLFVLRSRKYNTTCIYTYILSCSKITLLRSLNSYRQKQLCKKSIVILCFEWEHKYIFDRIFNFSNKNCVRNLTFMKPPVNEE